MNDPRGILEEFAELSYLGNLFRDALASGLRIRSDEKARRKAWWDNHPLKLRDRNRRYFAANRERLAAYKRAWRAKRKAHEHERDDADQV